MHNLRWELGCRIWDGMGIGLQNLGFGCRIWELGWELGWFSFPPGPAGFPSSEPSSLEVGREPCLRSILVFWGDFGDFL